MFSDTLLAELSDSIEITWEKALILIFDMLNLTFRLSICIVKYMRHTVEISTFFLNREHVLLVHCVSKPYVTVVGIWESNLEVEKASFGSHFESFKSRVPWFYCPPAVLRQKLVRKHVGEQSSLSPGRWEAKGGGHGSPSDSSGPCLFTCACEGHFIFRYKILLLAPKVCGYLMM